MKDAIEAKDLVEGERYAYRYERGGVNTGHCIVEYVSKKPFWKNKPIAVCFNPEFAKRITMRADSVSFFEPAN